jgi:hypothetical protein
MPDSPEAEKKAYPWWKLYSLIIGFLLFQILLYYWLTVRWH